MALKFYKPFSKKIKVISFDLDDTLYQNEEVIQLAEAKQFESICNLVPEAKTIGKQYWIDLKWQIAKLQPELCHDVTQWRKQVIESGLLGLGVDKKDVDRLSPTIFADFYDARSDFTVPDETFSVLEELQKLYPLVAVTNGNADIKRIGLAPYFVKYYRAGEQGTRMKPASDMLLLAAQQMQVLPEEILHIGDNIGSDIRSANNANCQSLWFNPSELDFSALTSLPSGEYTDIKDLLLLV